MLRLGMRLAAVTALLAGSLVATGAPAAASTACLSDNGTNVNAYFGIRRSDAIWLNLQGRQPPCVTVVQGRTFSRTHGWFAQLPPGTRVGGTTIQTVYPDGYRPDFAAPMVDFLSKITQARYVVSRNGKTEITRTVTRPQLFAHAKLGRFGDLFVAPDTTLAPGTTIYAQVPEWTTVELFSSRRLAVGEHVIEIYWTLSKQHCDGFGTVVANNCVPAGESITTSTPFMVVPRRG